MILNCERGLRTEIYSFLTLPLFVKIEGEVANASLTLFDKRCAFCVLDDHVSRCKM